MPSKLKVDMFYYINNTFQNIVFYILLAVFLTLAFKYPKPRIFFLKRMTYIYEKKVFRQNILLITTILLSKFDQKCYICLSYFGTYKYMYLY